MTNGGQDLLKELKEMISEPGMISEETYRRLLLTAMIGVLTSLNGLSENPAVYFGSLVKKYPKIFWFVILVVILVITFVDVRQAVYAFVGLPIKVTP